MRVTTPGCEVDNAQAIAFTSYHGNAQLVPNVVGLQESAATSALAEAGCRDWRVSRMVRLVRRALIARRR